MPTYAMQCNKCLLSGSIRLSFENYDAVKDGKSTLECNQCNGPCEIIFDPSTVQFTLKDGESGGWPGRSMKENAYRARRREIMGRRERDHVFKPSLQPNFQGVETGNWKDAQEYARTEIRKDHGKEAGDKVAKTFEPMLKKSSA